MSQGALPPSYWREMAEAPSPPRADREAGPREVNLPPEVVPRFGSFVFDYWGRIRVEDNPAPDPLQAHVIEFTVPEHLVGLVTGVAAGFFLPWYNDELAVELFVGEQPKLAAVVLNRARPAGIVLPPTPLVSADAAHPTEFFVPLGSSEIVYLAVARGTNANWSPTRYPDGDFPAAYGRLTGRFWPLRLGMTLGR